MQKVYLLLRQQEQSGPYSLADLKSLQLTESDLLWDTSKNSGWCYPFELGLPFGLSPTAEIKKKEVDPIIKRITDPAPQKKANVEQNIEEEVTLDELSEKITQLRQKIRLVEEQLSVDTPVASNKKLYKAKFKGPGSGRTRVFISVVAILAIALIIVAYQFLTAFRQKEQRNKTPKQENTSVQQPAAIVAADSAIQKNTDSTYTINYIPVEDSTSVVEVKNGNSFRKPLIHRRMKKSQVVVKRIPEVKSGSASVTASTPVTAFPPNVDYTHKPAQVNFVEGEQKKKGVLRKVFGKKEVQQPESANPEQDLIESINVSTSTTRYKWLKGVQGLIVNMNNNSNKTIVRAQVDILFFNDQNCIIERDTKVFTNVLPGKSQGIAVSDRPYAQHAGYQVISITAKR